MLSKYEFAPSADMQYTTTVVFDIGAVDTSQMPITNLSFEYAREGTRRPKMEKVGSWLGYNKINELLVHTDFDIIADDTSAFNTKKFNLRGAISPADPGLLSTVDALGTLTLRFDGYTEDVAAPVTIDGDISIPYVGPAYTNATLTWIVAQGYFVGLSSGDFYYPS